MFVTNIFTNTSGSGDDEMATFAQRGKSVEAVIRRKGHRALYKRFKTKSEAQEWARKQESQLDEGRKIQRDNRLTFAEAMDCYVDEYLIHKKTYKVDKYGLAKLRKRIGYLIIGDITSRMLREYRIERSKEFKPATVNKELAYINRVMTYAQSELDVVFDGGIPKVAKLTLNNGRDRRVSQAELNRILKQSESTMQTVIQLAVETGMRRGELVKIKRKDIDYRSRTVHLYDTKNGENRIVPLSSAAIAALKSLPARIDGKVFDIHPDTVSKRFLRACRSAGIEDLRFHDLRHEAVSRLFEKGLNPMEVAAISGHKTLQMLKRYTHLRAEDLAKKLG